MRLPPYVMAYQIEINSIIGTLFQKKTRTDSRIGLGEHSGEPYARTGEAKRVKITYLEDQTRLNVYYTLRKAGQAIKAKYGRAPGVFAISDLAKDKDDLTALLPLKGLDRSGIIEFEGLIANLELAYKRAIYRRGALDSLGL
ncbi:hypothetical protein G7Y89_g2838 [Cudoniella acicularis]|uniref:Uncharacterized protein n=1 Tax=Cudoniella acicularis TaxID=354080 RepID=A0A8H4W6K1_9HELO|nr:hypothetical protein G7Y89_g2838 [Cudoniella acicularis]